MLALGDEQFLVDAGSGVGVQLVQAGVRPYDWPRVAVTVSAFTVDHDAVTPAFG